MTLGQMHLEVDGNPYGGWSSAKAMRSMETVAGSFEFHASITDPNKFAFQLGSKCRVMLDNEPIIVGYVDGIDINYNSSSHSVTVSGRSRTADLVDSSLVGGEATGSTTQMSIKTIIEQVLKANGQKFKVLDRAPGAKEFAPGEAPASEIGATIWQHLEKCCRSRQVILNTTRAGEISIERAGAYPLEDISLINVKSRPKECNIISARVNYSTVDRFRHYKMVSQSALPGLEMGGATDQPAQAANQSGEATDTTIRVGRTLLLNESGLPMSTGTLFDRAKWEANIRRARSMTYSATVHGWYRDKGQSLFYRPNRLIRVVDEMAAIDSVLLIKEVTYNYSIDGGATSDVVCVTPDAYTLDVERPAKQKRGKQKIGINIASSTQ